MFDRRTRLGVLLGVCLAAGVLGVADRFRASAAYRDAAPVLTECKGTLRELVIQYVADAAPFVEKAYRGFLAALPEEVLVYVVCPDRAAFDDLSARVGSVACQLEPVLVGHEMSTWSRDRWIALESVKAGGAVTLLHPRGEAAADLWPQRAGDARIARDLAAALPKSICSERSALYFDGGDFASDSQTVFVAPALVRRNVQKTLRTQDELLAALARILKRKVVLLSDAPDHHVGMYMMPVGEGTVLVGDPALAHDILSACRKGTSVLGGQGGGEDFSSATQQRFEAVASQCAAAGYRVVRIPVVPGCDGRTWLTYVNVIQDERNGQRVVYMPVYDRAEELNEYATGVWNDLGYEVRPVDCTNVFPHYGSLHCLVNVLRRG